MNNLEINAARVSFGDYEALKGVTFVAGKGQFITMLGPSGCGKTTLLKVIAGFHPLDSGSVMIGGRNMAKVPPERRNTAMCFQSYALFPHLNVAENIAFGLRQNKTLSHEVERRVIESASQVSLTAQLTKYPAQLSGGQQQRVALARALAVRPGIVLFDEPLSNLDARLRDQVRIEICQLQRSYGFTAVYVTHDQSEALAMSDRVIVMNAGIIEQIGTPHEVYYSPINRFVANFVGTANVMAVLVTTQDRVNGKYQISSPLGELMIQSARPPINHSVYVFWRPEDAVLISSAQANENTIAFTVSSTSFLGNVSDINVRLAGTQSAEVDWRIQLPGMVTLSKGQRILFAIPPDKLRFLQEPVQ